MHFRCTRGGHWGVLETKKPKKKSSKTAKPQKNSAKTENRIQNRQKTDTMVTSGAYMLMFMLIQACLLT